LIDTLACSASSSDSFFFFLTFVVEGAAVEVATMVAVVEAAVEVDTMRRRGSQANKIGEVEDVVVGEAAGQITRMSSAISVANMVTMQKTTTPISITIAARSGITQKIAMPRRKWRITLTLSQRMR
jgi:hypothetical protein